MTDQYHKTTVKDCVVVYKGKIVNSEGLHTNQL